jgi:hypothetical protein
MLISTFNFQLSTSSPRTAPHNANPSTNPRYTSPGGERGPVVLMVFKTIARVLRGFGGGFDSHTLPPDRAYFQWVRKRPSGQTWAIRNSSNCRLRINDSRGTDDKPTFAGAVAQATTIMLRRCSWLFWSLKLEGGVCVGLRMAN